MNNLNELVLSLVRAKLEFSRKIAKAANNVDADTSQSVQDIENIDKIIVVIKSLDGVIKPFAKI